jgi:hypothetical protein
MAKESNPEALRKLTDTFRRLGARDPHSWAASQIEFLDDDMPPVSWGLFQLDEEGNPLAPIDFLHESVLGMDPTGREMRPRRPT